jgi:hypothetical protein
VSPFRAIVNPYVASRSSSAKATIWSNIGSLSWSILAASGKRQQIAMRDAPRTDAAKHHVNAVLPNIVPIADGKTAKKKDPGNNPGSLSMDQVGSGRRR